MFLSDKDYTNTIESRMIYERHSVRSYSDKKIEGETLDNQPVITADGKGPFIKVDLGIVKYNFEVGYRGE